MMARACAEDLLPAEVDDVAPVRVVRLAHVSPKIFGCEIPEQRYLPMLTRPRDLGELVQG
jgi:hypothetical protein